MKITQGCQCNTSECAVHVRGAPLPPTWAWSLVQGLGNPMLGGPETVGAFDAASAPCAFIVERDGLQLAVCTYCDRSTDRYVARLFDAETDFAVFASYDVLGALVIKPLVDDAAWEEFQKRSG